MNRITAFAGAAALLAGGCTTVEPMDYARTLCETVPRAEFSTCASRVLDHYRASARMTDTPFGYSTSGPFAMVIADQLYLGRYRSDPFAAAFEAAHDGEVCRGHYDAGAGSFDAILAVRCDDGRTGTADLVLDQGGRNGIGTVQFDDGTRGRIVFGHGAAGAAPSGA
ncbi:hypothetical protein [Thiococcus pfennigii]|jgi:hypothetical protein|uniref:hypothetical protein n=1 Tax=Thiococcus pfennigii TaxID=1057 RepID=UPI0019075360|nr:hypothetical protein [Thiococcus pfennigii]MBK1700292.1 hypothetical protein [Thiococcus pfennigii]MBK1731466.1 hypothetical protein [Thiococcus pfennigii]